MTTGFLLLDVHKLRVYFFQFMNANSVNRALGALEKSGVDLVSEAGNSDTSQQAASAKKAQQTRRKSLANTVLKVYTYTHSQDIDETSNVL